MITIFENFENPDLRRIGEYVLCIKDYGYDDWALFKKDNYYRVVGCIGDSEGAIRIGINDYVPVEFISMISILAENNITNEFNININGKYKTDKWNCDFFEYFEIPEFTNDITKYNL